MYLQNSQEYTAAAIALLRLSVYKSISVLLFF